MATISEVIRVSTDGESLRWFAVCLSCGIRHLTEGEGDVGRRNAWEEIRGHVNKGFWTHDTKAVRLDMIIAFDNQKLNNESLG